jgi:hypothetical protein
VCVAPVRVRAGEEGLTLVGAAVGVEVGKAVGAAVGRSVGAAVGEAVGESVGAAVGGCRRNGREARLNDNTRPPLERWMKHVPPWEPPSERQSGSRWARPWVPGRWQEGERTRDLGPSGAVWSTLPWQPLPRWEPAWASRSASSWEMKWGTAVAQYHESGLTNREKFPLQRMHDVLHSVTTRI